MGLDRNILTFLYGTGKPTEFTISELREGLKEYIPPIPLNESRLSELVGLGHIEQKGEMLRLTKSGEDYLMNVLEI